jgi:hypothetical protein
MLGISWVAAQFAASQEGLSSMSEWVRLKICGSSLISVHLIWFFLVWPATLLTNLTSAVSIFFCRSPNIGAICKYRYRHSFIKFRLCRLFLSRNSVLHNWLNLLILSCSSQVFWLKFCAFSNPSDIFYKPRPPLNLWFVHLAVSVASAYLIQCSN